MTDADIRRRLLNGETLKYYKLLPDGTIVRKTREEAEAYEKAHEQRKVK